MTILPDPQDSRTVLLVKFAALMFTLSVIGLVVLMITGKPTDALERLVTPLITAVIVTGILGISTSAEASKRRDHRRKDDKSRESSKDE